MTSTKNQTNRRNSPLSGLNVLLAEDSKINQEIASELLSQAGMSVRIVNNGEEALKILEQEKYDIILMDLQMPVMDGYEATQKIRSQDKFLQVPIIAMTADKSDKERTRCLEIGMNDHVVKSLDPANLYKAMEESLGMIPTLYASGATALTPDSHSTEAQLPEQLPGIQLKKALDNVGGNVKLLYKLLKEFTEDHSRDIDKIKTAINSNDTTKARRIAHTLQGISGSLGMDSVNAIASALESTLKSGEDCFHDVLLEGLEDPLKEALSSIASLLIEHPHESSLHEEDTQQQQLLERLRQYCQEMSPDGEELSEKLMKQLKGSQHEKEAATLHQKICNFDFEQALLIIYALNQELTGSAEA